VEKKWADIKDTAVKLRNQDNINSVPDNGIEYYRLICDLFDEEGSLVSEEKADIITGGKICDSIQKVFQVLDSNLKQIVSMAEDSKRLANRKMQDKDDKIIDLTMKHKTDQPLSPIVPTEMEIDVCKVESSQPKNAAHMLKASQDSTNPAGSAPTTPLTTIDYITEDLKKRETIVSSRLTPIQSTNYLRDQLVGQPPVSYSPHQSTVTIPKAPRVSIMGLPNSKHRVEYRRSQQHPLVPWGETTTDDISQTRPDTPVVSSTSHPVQPIKMEAQDLPAKKTTRPPWCKRQLDQKTTRPPWCKRQLDVNQQVKRVTEPAEIDITSDDQSSGASSGQKRLSTSNTEGT
jgi:hypothetical protein